MVVGQKNPLRLRPARAALPMLAALHGMKESRAMNLG
jgi:hypothetical protein